jgi:hypothetical protein
MIDNLKDPTNWLVDEPLAFLERTYFLQFLRQRGYSLADLKILPPEEARRLRIGACMYAALRLAELEARARFVDDLFHA